MMRSGVWRRSSWRRRSWDEPLLLKISNMLTPLAAEFPWIAAVQNKSAILNPAEVLPELV